MILNDRMQDKLCSFDSWVSDTKHFLLNNFYVRCPTAISITVLQNGNRKIIPSWKLELAGRLQIDYDLFNPSRVYNDLNNIPQNLEFRPRKNTEYFFSKVYFSVALNFQLLRLLMVIITRKETPAQSMNFLEVKCQFIVVLQLQRILLILLPQKLHHVITRFCP